MYCFSVRSFVISGLILGVFCAPVYAANLTLNVVEENLKTGNLYIEFYQVSSDQPEGKRIVLSEIFNFEPIKKTSTFQISDLPEGELCARMFLDQNLNQKLDTSNMGVPIEPVGFANNPALFFGEPDIQSACFNLQPDNNIQTIELKTNKRRRNPKK